jgi:hypothetical protein
MKRRGPAARRAGFDRRNYLAYYFVPSECVLSETTGCFVSCCELRNPGKCQFDCRELQGQSRITCCPGSLHGALCCGPSRICGRLPPSFAHHTSPSLMPLSFRGGSNLACRAPSMATSAEACHRPAETHLRTPPPAHLRQKRRTTNRLARQPRPPSRGAGLGRW